MKKGGFIYILTNKNNTVLYVGVTSDLQKRIWQHRNGLFKNAFTSKYNVYKLVHFEEYDSIESAIAREKQLKAGSRQKKIDLINNKNPQWKELYKNIQ
jgi:putative endonuclease